MKNRVLVYLLAFATLFGFSATTSFAKDVRFAVASDVHYTANPDGTEKDDAVATKALKGFVTRMNENDYDFVIFLGDSIDRSKKYNLEGFLKNVKNIKSPYYLVLGNKDAHKISGMDKKLFLETVAKTNKNQKKAQASYYFYPTKDVVVIVLDNVSSGMPSNHGVFNQRTLTWLDEVLTKNKDKKAVIFQHVPVVAPYDNPALTILEDGNFRATLLQHENVLAVFGGHYHQAMTKTDSRGITHICVPALSEAPYSYMDMTVKYNKKPLAKAKNFNIKGTLKPAI